MELVAIDKGNIEEAAALAADFRVALKGYVGVTAAPDREAGLAELQGYLGAGFPMYAALQDGAPVGYRVCRVDTPTVWLESLFVRADARRQGVASALLQKAEEIAAGCGEPTLYHNVHPNNDGMIAFLRRHGYTVLNLIEIRKPYPGEEPAKVIRVGTNAFDY